MKKIVLTGLGLIVLGTVGLGPVARREWDRLTAELAPLRILTHLDRAALAAYCGAYAMWAYRQ
jgi:phage terminase small subunit